MDLDQSLQDVLRCHPCETPVPELYCKYCRINLCKKCAGEHLLDESKLHNVVPIKQKWYPTNPTNPECLEHSNKRCELFCKKCDIPICAHCVSSQEHKDHDVVEIFEHFEHAKQSLIKDLQELETSIYPRYDEISSLIPIQKYHLRKNLNSVMKVLDKHRRKWHGTIENVVEDLWTKIVELNSTQLMELERQESEINHNTTNLSQFIQYLQNLEENNDVLDISKYKSRIDEFRKLLPCFEISLLTFVPSTISSSQFLEQFGSLSEYPLKKEEIVTEIKHEEDVSSSEVSRIALEDVYDFLDIFEISPLFQKYVYGNEESVIEYQEDELSTLCLTQLDHFEFNTGDNSLTSIACQSDEKIWTTNAGKLIKLYNFHGELLMSVPSKSEFPPSGIAITQHGDLVYTDFNDKSVNIVIKNEITQMIKLHGWRPQGVCSTSCNQLLIIMDSDDRKKTKVVRFAGDKVKQNIQWDDKGEPLFSSESRYLCENRNFDICVVDRGIRAIVVLNSKGKLRFIYKYPVSNSKNLELSNPVGIATNSQGWILTSDFNNDRIHIIDQDGMFLHFLDFSGQLKISTLCVDSKDCLFVADLNSGKVSKIHAFKLIV